MLFDKFRASKFDYDWHEWFSFNTANYRKRRWNNGKFLKGRGGLHVWIAKTLNVSWRKLYSRVVQTYFVERRSQRYNDCCIGKKTRVTSYSVRIVRSYLLGVGAFWKTTCSRRVNAVRSNRLTPWGIILENPTITATTITTVTVVRKSNHWL